MLTDLKKAALVAGTAMGIRVLWDLAETIWTAVAPGAGIRGGSAAILVGMQLIYVPLPLVFLLLYKTGIALPVSRSGRYLAMAAALIEAVVVAASGLDRLRGDTRLISGPLYLLSGLAFLFLLIALSRPASVPLDVDARRSNLLKAAAQVAMFAGGVAVFMSIGGVLFEVWVRSGGLPSVHFPNVTTARILQTGLAGLPWLIAPFIVRSGLSTL